MKFSLQFSLLAVVFIFSFHSFAQFPGCPNIDAGSNVNLDCSTPCTDLTANPFEVGATTTYIVQSIPHTPPIAYNAAGGTGVSVNTDDVWSGVINLPFDFCFYGQTYNSCTIGSNGCIKFGTSLANAYHPWSYTETIPSTNLTDAGDIFGPYHDIDPSVSGNIRWYLLGTAPCRIFVVAFDALAHYSCTNLTSTHMIVLYETTNAIDVYVQNKATCGSWNSGNTVIGIQNPAGTTGLTPPGRNTGAWTVNTPEAWRFLPDGAPIYTVEWFENGNSIGTGNTVNVCPISTTTYTANVTYTSCNGQIIVETDDVTVSTAPSDLVANVVTTAPASCGIADGSAEISGSGGLPGYTYSDDNVTYSASGSFTGLTAGPHTLYVQDANGCISAVIVDIAENVDLTISIDDLQNISCNGEADGEISVTVSNGTAPYTLTLNGGSGSSNTTFAGLSAGSYTIEVTDAGGCSTDVSASITEPAVLNLSLVSSEDETCSDSNGEIIVNGSGGTGSYTYSISGGSSSQPSGTFTGLDGGTYMLYVSDANACSDSLEVIIDELEAPTLSLISTDEVCFQVADGEVEVAASGGSAPYAYVVNNGTPQASGAFTGLPAGTHTFTAIDANGCDTELQVVVGQIPLPQVQNDAIGCLFGIQLNGTSAQGNGQWSAADTCIHFTPNDQVYNPFVYTTVPGVYTLTFTDDICGNTATVDINFPNYVFVYSPDTTVCVGTEYTIATTVEPSVTEYAWNVGLNTPSITVTEPGVYIVEVSNVCHSGSDTIIVQHKVCDIFAPNVISLSSNTGNQTWYVTADGVKEFNCIILNRWGNLIYEFNQVEGQWDGTSNGNKVAEGTYFYKIDAVMENGDELQKHGFIQVIH
jgi:gliding motility-associated-like protein